MATIVTATRRTRDPVNINWAAGDSISAYNQWPQSPDPWLLPWPVQGHGFGGGGFVYGGGQIQSVWWNRYNSPPYWPRPTRTTVMGGVNDIGNGVSAAAVLAAMVTFKADVEAVGVRVYMMTEPWWLYNLGPLNTLMRSTFTTDLIDLEPLISGNGTYTNDSVHPNIAGQRVMAAAIAEVLGP